MIRELIFTLGSKLGLTYCLHRLKKGHLTVLSLHRISEEEDFFFQPIRPDLFIKLLEYVTRKYTVINFQMLNANKNYGKPPLILSFDDGYYDFIDCALPIISKFGIPVNHNLVNSCLNGSTTIWTQELNDIFMHLKNYNIVDNAFINKYGKNFKNCNGNWFIYYEYFFKFLLGIKYNQRKYILDSLLKQYSVYSKYKMINWIDAAKLIECGVEIGSHSYSHDSLSNLTTEEELKNEIYYSIREMENKLNIKVTILAPPNGQCNETIISYAQKIGIKNILLVNNQINLLSNFSTRFNKVNRIGMCNESENEMLLRSELFHSRIRTLK